MASANDAKWQKDAADQNFDYMFKLLIIGNSSVGKTSFLFRYADDSFTSAFVSTVGIDFKVKTVFRQDKRVKLQIWVSWFDLMHITRKAVFGGLFPGKTQLWKLARVVIGTLEIASVGIVLSKQPVTKTLIRLRGSGLICIFIFGIWDIQVFSWWGL